MVKSLLNFLQYVETFLSQELVDCLIRVEEFLPRHQRVAHGTVLALLSELLLCVHYIEKLLGVGGELLDKLLPLRLVPEHAGAHYELGLHHDVVRRVVRVPQLCLPFAVVYLLRQLLFLLLAAWIASDKVALLAGVDEEMEAGEVPVLVAPLYKRVTVYQR